MDNSLRLYRATINAMTNEYDSRENTGGSGSGSAVTKTAIRQQYDYWNDARELPTPEETDAAVEKTLNVFQEFLESDQSPYSRAEKQDPDTFGTLIATVKPSGLLHSYIRSTTFDGRPQERANFMKQFTDFIHNIEKTTKKAQTSRVKLVLAQFPQRTSAEYQCVSGTRSRMLIANKQLASPAFHTITAGYALAAFHLSVKATPSVLTGNQVHIDGAINYLMGLPQKTVAKIDPNYTLPLIQMSADDAWHAYQMTLRPAKDIKNYILAQASAITAAPPENGELLKEATKSTFFMPWGLDAEETKQQFYDPEMFTVERKQVPVNNDSNTPTREETDTEFSARLHDHLVQLMLVKTNEFAFGSQDIPWYETAEDTDANDNIIKVDQLLTDRGQLQLLDYISEVIDNDYIVETTQQQAALHALFLFSRETRASKPCMVVKVIHMLGALHENSLFEENIEDGMDILNRIQNKNTDLADILDSTKERVDFLCNNEFDYANVERSGIAEYVGYLRGTHTDVDVNLLYSMMVNGASQEHISEAVAETSIDELYITDERGGSIADVAALSGYQKIAIDIFEKCPSLLDTINIDDDTHLHKAFKNAHKDIVMYLCQKHAHLLKRCNEDGMTPFGIAIKEKQFDLLKDIHTQIPECFSVTDIDNNTILHQATLTNDVDKIKRVFQIVPEFSRRENYFGRTPLHLAIENNHVEAVKTLCTLDPELLKQSHSMGNTFLNVALKAGNLDVVKLLHEFEPDLLHTENLFGDTPLSFAIQFSSTAIVDYLTHVDTAAVDNFDKYALLYNAVTSGNLNSLKNLCHFGTDVLLEKDDDGDSPLHLAIKAEKPEILEYIITNHPAARNDIAMYKNNTMDTIFHLAARCKNDRILALVDTIYHSCLTSTEESYRSRLMDTRQLQILDILMQTNSDGDTVFHIAAQKDNYKVIENMYTHMPRMDVSVLRKGNKHGCTPLHIAVQHEHHRVMRQLCQYDLGLSNIKDQNQYTPLHTAAHTGNLEAIDGIVTRVARARGPVNRLLGQQDANGSTLLHLAAKMGHLHVLDYFRDKPVKDILVIQDNAGQTPLHVAVENGEPIIVDCLANHVFKESYRHIRNNAGKTALECATDAERNDLAHILR